MREISKEIKEYCGVIGNDSRKCEYNQNISRKNIITRKKN
jgi:hypothetical protein